MLACRGSNYIRDPIGIRSGFGTDSLVRSDPSVIRACRLLLFSSQHFLFLESIFFSIGELPSHESKRMLRFDVSTLSVFLVSGMRRLAREYANFYWRKMQNQRRNPCMQFKSADHYSIIGARKNDPGKAIQGSMI